MKNLCLLGILISVSLIYCKTKETVTVEEPMAKAASNFKQFCTPCHGDDGDVFVDRTFRHGDGKDSLISSIAMGHVDSEMVSFKDKMSETEIAALADYLGQAIERRKAYDFTDSITSNVFHHQSMSVKLDTIASGLTSPWGMAFLPSGDYIYTDRNGSLYRQSKGKQTLIKGTPPSLVEQQGGLLDVATHPDFAKNQIIYLTYSKFRDSADKKLSTTALFKAKLDGNSLKEGKDIFVAVPYQLTRIHYGSRIDFDKEGHIFLTVGDRFQHLDTLPQKLNVDMGKIHRLNDDGSIPKDNPFVDVPGAHGSIWSIGHRNLQGLYINPADGTVWENEHGPRGGDEVNIIEKGKNYGWPLVSYGINYNGKIMTPFTTKEGMEQPKVKWVPSIGPSGMTIVSGDKYPAWKGDLLVGSLRFKYLDRIHLEGTTPGAEEPLLKNLGRMRFVKMGPDGYIYVGVETPGFIFKLEPVNAQ